MKCPWCGEKVAIGEFEKHLASCPKYLPGMRPKATTTADERPKLIKRLRDTVSKLPSFRIKWTDVDKMSISELRETVEHIEKQLTHHSSNPEEIGQPTLKELLKGEVLNGYLEASRVRTLEQFMPFTFLFDEGLPTEEKITVKAINEFEAAIKARDEFTKRRGTYHKTSRLVG